MRLTGESALISRIDADDACLARRERGLVPRDPDPEFSRQAVAIHRPRGRSRV